MTVDDTLRDLSRQGADLQAVYVGVGNAEDRYAIVKSADLWNVYYLEKEEKQQWQQFSTESDACIYLLTLLAKDQTVWKNRSI